MDYAGKNFISNISYPKRVVSSISLASTILIAASFNDGMICEMKSFKKIATLEEDRRGF